jgi:hypothetical protein
MENMTMKRYIGTKIITAQPMNRADYNTYRGWVLPSDENGEDEGYLVEYLDGGKPNDSRHTGYISWSPKKQFEGAYRESSGMTFGHAIEALKKGHKVARAGWNGKGMWLGLVTPQDDTVTGGQIEFVLVGLAGKVGPCLPWIGMRTAADEFVPWLASQTDMLSEDWRLVE